MFGRKKQDETLNEQLQTQAARPGAKNRPTPKRRDQEAANRRPLVITDRKAAAAQDREARREATARQRQAMVTGDDKNLPARDRGPERRFIRDWVDARWSLGEFLLPIMLVVLALTFTGQSWAVSVMYLVVYGVFAIAIIDAILMWRRVKGRIIAKFGADKLPAGGAMYACMRCFQMRFTRMPKPQVSRGQYPA